MPAARGPSSRPGLSLSVGRCSLSVDCFGLDLITAGSPCHPARDPRSTTRSRLLCRPRPPCLTRHARPRHRAPTTAGRPATVSSAPCARDARPGLAAIAAVGLVAGGTAGARLAGRRRGGPGRLDLRDDRLGACVDRPCRDVVVAAPGRSRRQPQSPPARRWSASARCLAGPPRYRGRRGGYGPRRGTQRPPRHRPGHAGRARLVRLGVRLPRRPVGRREQLGPARREPVVGRVRHPAGPPGGQDGDRRQRLGRPTR